MARRNRFVLPGIERVPLTDGDWVEFKSKITYGEDQFVQSSSMSSITYSAEKAEAGETEIGLDLKRHAIVRLLTWIHDWSFTDHAGKYMPVNRTNIENLDPDAAAELTAALDKHIEAASAKKQTPTTETVYALS